MISILNSGKLSWSNQPGGMNGPNPLKVVAAQQVSRLEIGLGVGVLAHPLIERCPGIGLDVLRRGARGAQRDTCDNRSEHRRKQINRPHRGLRKLVPTCVFLRLAPAPTLPSGHLAIALLPRATATECAEARAEREVSISFVEEKC